MSPHEVREGRRGAQRVRAFAQAAMVELRSSAVAERVTAGAAGGRGLVVPLGGVAPDAGGAIVARRALVGDVAALAASVAVDPVQAGATIGGVTGGASGWCCGAAGAVRAMARRARDARAVAAGGRSRVAARARGRGPARAAVRLVAALATPVPARGGARLGGVARRARGGGRPRPVRSAGVARLAVGVTRSRDRSAGG
jgi:hypothetical protein